jgi:L-methionine (R)-S-oxide reductase
MAEDLMISQGNKTEKYRNIIPQIQALVESEPDSIANMANITATLKEQFGWLWVGFYLVRQDQLVLGPFQGPVACTRIRKGRGVCGTCWEKAQTIIVPDVSAFPGHIACSSLSNSEIVLPIMEEGRVIGVLDVDSEKYNDFDETDRRGLEQVLGFITIRS